jgi:MFS family permease
MVITSPRMSQTYADPAEDTLQQTQPPASSFWQELLDGSASVGMKIAISFALAPLLAGVGLIGSYVLAAYFPGFSRNYGYPGWVRPKDEMVGCVLGLCAVLYVATLAWLWTRNRRRHRTFWGAALATFGITIATVIAGAMADEAFKGGEDYVIAGLVFVALAGVILVWTFAARRYARPKPLIDPTDGTLDVRCPACDYRMVGLHESRCPECGTAYTLDELLARQAFITRAHKRAAWTPRTPNGNGHATPPPVPPTVSQHVSAERP